MHPLPFSLVCHPDTPARKVTAISGRMTPEADWVRVRWRIDGAGSLVVPPFAGKGRADNLWQTTCFELFVAEADGANYSEFNLSPSERWAAYDFARRREGMVDRALDHEPVCTMRIGETMAIFDAAIPRSALPVMPWRCGISAVIEEAGGHRSYWALVHDGGKPDFHDPACFVLPVAAPQAA